VSHEDRKIGVRLQHLARLDIVEDAFEGDRDEAVLGKERHDVREQGATVVGGEQRELGLDEHDRAEDGASSVQHLQLVTLCIELQIGAPRPVGDPRPKDVEPLDADRLYAERS
jgi:hypothetical protein